MLRLWVAPTKHNHHRLDELDGRPLAVDGAAGVHLEHHGLLLHVGVDPHVDADHDQEQDQVGARPEGEVAPREDGSQLGARAQVADAVPAQTGHGPHEYGDGPDQHDQQGHPPLSQVAVDLPVHDGDVALQSYDQQVGQRGRQADVQHALAEEVLVNRQLPWHIARVEHEVHVGDAREEVRGGEVGQKIVEGIVKSLVGDHGSYDHGVGEQNETAEQRAHHLHQDELSFVPVVLCAGVVVEEAHELVIVTGVVVTGHFRGDSEKGEGTFLNHQRNKLFIWNIFSPITDCQNSCQIILPSFLINIWEI